MKKNLGNADRFIRLLIAAAVAVLYFTNMISGTLAVVLLVFAGILLLTSFVGTCPIYSILGVNTCPAKTER